MNNIVLFLMGVLTGMLILTYVAIFVNRYIEKTKNKQNKTPLPEVHTKEDFAQETGIDYFYDIKLNGIQGYCSNMCIEHKAETAEIHNANLNIPPFAWVEFDYRNGYYKGRGIVRMKGFNSNTKCYDYYIEIHKYNCT